MCVYIVHDKYAKLGSLTLEFVHSVPQRGVMGGGGGGAPDPRGGGIKIRREKRRKSVKAHRARYS